MEEPPLCRFGCLKTGAKNGEKAAAGNNVKLFIRVILRRVHITVRSRSSMIIQRHIGVETPGPPIDIRGRILDLAERLDWQV
jgi:hypothetical protein